MEAYSSVSIVNRDQTHEKVLDRVESRGNRPVGSSLVAGQEFAAGTGPTQPSLNNGAS